MGQDNEERNFGPQPLDKIMTDLGMGNHRLVEVCREPLTHKAVQRARKGRRLTPHMQRRIVEAFNLAAAPETPLQRPDLFSYKA